MIPELPEPDSVKCHKWRYSQVSQSVTLWLIVDALQSLLPAGAQLHHRQIGPFENDFWQFVTEPKRFAVCAFGSTRAEFCFES